MYGLQILCTFLRRQWGYIFLNFKQREHAQCQVFSGFILFIFCINHDEHFLSANQIGIKFSLSSNRVFEVCVFQCAVEIASV